MKVEDLDHIEHSLGLTLPAEYRATMLAYPFPTDSPAAELWLLDDGARLLEINQGYRRDRHGRSALPPHLFIVGDDGGEEAFVLDTSSSPNPVLVYELETGRRRPYTPDFLAFVHQQWEELRLIEEDERAMAEGYRKKKWWQFWIRPPAADAAPLDGHTKIRP